MKHVTFQVEGLAPTSDSEAVGDPEFDRNRVLMQAAQLMFADSGLTQEQRGVLKSRASLRNGEY